MNLKCTAQMPETCWKKCPFVTRLTESNGTVQINESCDTMKLRFKSKQWWKWNREAIMKWKIWNNDVAGMEWNNAALILLASFLMKTLLMWIDCSKLSFNESDEPSVQLWWCETVAVSCDLMKALKAWCSCDDEWLWSGEDMKAIMTQNCEATKLRQLKVKKSNAASINLALTVKLCFCENCHCVTLWSCNSIKALKLPVWLSCDEQKLWSFHSSKTMTTWIDWALMQSCHQSAKVLMTQSQFLQFWSKLNNFSNEFETNRKHDLHSIFQKLHQSNQCENKISNCFCSLVRWMLRVGTVWNMCCSNLSLTTLIENNLITETFSSNSDNLTKWCGTTVFLKTRFNPCKGNSTDKSQLQAFGFFGHTNQCANSSCWIPQHLNPFSQGQQFSVIVIRFWYGKPIPTHKVVTDVEQHVLCLPKWCKKGSAVETEQRTLSPVPKSSTLEPIPMSSSAQSLFVVWWDSHKCHSWSCSCCWKTDECCFLIRSEKCKNAKQKCIGFNKKGSQVCGQQLTWWAAEKDSLWIGSPCLLGNAMEVNSFSHWGWPKIIDHRINRMNKEQCMNHNVRCWPITSLRSIDCWWPPLCILIAPKLGKTSSAASTRAAANFTKNHQQLAVSTESPHRCAAAASGSSCFCQAVLDPWLHFPFWCSFMGEGGGTFNVLESPLFLLLFRVFLLFLKVPKQTPDLRKIEGIGKASWTLAFSFRLTNSGWSAQSTQNGCKLVFSKSTRSTSWWPAMQRNKQTHTTVGLSLHLTHDSIGLLIFSLMDTMTLPDCQVRWSHSIQTFQCACTICWSLCSWINNVDNFPPKNIQSSSDLCHAFSVAGNGGTCSESCFLVFLQEQGIANMIQKEGKMRKRGIPQRKMQPSWDPLSTGVPVAWNLSNKS